MIFKGVEAMQKKSEVFPKKIYLRPALEERLAQILAVPLTVAAAPFGYGKTTAVKKVLLSLPVDMLWDTAIQEQKRFFGAALSNRCRPWVWILLR